MKPAFDGTDRSGAYAEFYSAADEQHAPQLSTSRLSRPMPGGVHAGLAALGAGSTHRASGDDLRVMAAHPNVFAHILPGRHAFGADGTVVLYPNAQLGRLAVGTSASIADYENAAFVGRPAASPNDRVDLGQRRFVTAPLSQLRFSRRIVCPEGGRPQPFSISNLLPHANLSASVLADEQGNRDEAVSRLRDIDILMLGHYPSTLGLLQQHAARSYQIVKNTDLDADDLSMAISHYRSYGDHILMNAILGGHRSLAGFLGHTMPERYGSEQQVHAWAQDFLYKFGAAQMYEPRELIERFDNDDELQLDTRALDKFLRHGDVISDVVVVKGMSSIRSDGDAEMSTAVYGRDYVRAFLMNQPIMYDGFLSTTFEPAQAKAFSEETDPATHPRYVIDFNDTTGKSEVLRRHALADLHNAEDVDQTFATMLVVRSRAGRGKVLDSSDAPGIGDEKELLFSGGHVLMPSMAIRCEKGYVLLADAYHRDFVR
ncbi:hypothetical protein [Burkholderia arboris]|uniref:hypothetical protein n=1 Tax=Burkholderia arboris TaxID=488730 RepID=UPI0015886FA9|nr:hypothetical protein [Burkholderia arboris]